MADGALGLENPVFMSVFPTIVCAAPLRDLNVLFRLMRRDGYYATGMVASLGPTLKELVWVQRRRYLSHRIHLLPDNCDFDVVGINILP